MLVTENQAKTSFCPFDPSGSKCVSSVCLMAWRWADADIEIVVTDTAEPPPGEGWELRGQIGKSRKRWSWSRAWGDRRRGYCGAAGKPEPTWNTAVVPAEIEE